MKITRLYIKKFRNLKDIDCTPCDGVNVIYGENGQGKTNILEAIWLCTGEKSFRGAQTSELIPLDDNFSSFMVSFDDFKRENMTKITLGEKKEILLNSVEIESFSALSGSFCCVVFSPVHLNLIKGAPADRRKSLDSVIGQIKPRFSSLMAEYNKLLFQRNSLLKDIPLSTSLLDTLDIWDEALANKGALIAKTRETFVNRLLEFSKDFYTGISSGKETLNFYYKSSLSENSEITPETMLKQLKANRTNDIKSGITSVGPHRDDLYIEINGISAKAFGSQGQQRSAVLALKLGECALMEDILNQSPVILLDDVMSELDDSRRDFLLHRLKGRQIFITCCDYRQIADADKLFNIQSGKFITTNS